MFKNVKTVNRTLSVVERCWKYGSVCARNLNAWTQDRIIKSPFANIEIPNCTLYDYVWQNLDKWPERTASVCATTGRGYTYEQAFKLSNTFAANLRTKLKLKDGDIVAVMLPNIPDFPLVTLGILEAGGVVSTINPVYTAHEVHRQLVVCDAKLVVTLRETVSVVKEALKLAKLNIPIIAVRTNGNAVTEGTILFNELTEDVHVDKSCLKQVRRSINDICFLPYSSGTTGLPKGVELSSKNIIANCEQINEPRIRAHNETTETHQDAVMAVLPFFHIYGATVIMFHKMSQGLKLVTLAKFQPEDFLEALKKYKTNLLFVAPPLVLMMASHPAASPETLQYLETVINGAAPLAVTDANRFFDRCKRKIDFRQGYGLTETSPVVSLTPRGLENYGSVGYPVPNTELKIVDSDMKSLGPNEKGELLVRGPQVMRGYRNNVQANTESFTVDGWFKTGDIAFGDDSGMITIFDRLKELIKSTGGIRTKDLEGSKYYPRLQERIKKYCFKLPSDLASVHLVEDLRKVKGYQVPPAELEAILREHPAIIDAAVVGVPHPTKGESPKAFVVLRSGNKANVKEISDFVSEKVAPYKRIDNIVFIDGIPKSSAGKILRRVLKEEFCK